MKVLESKWIVVVLEDHLGDSNGSAAVDLERLTRRYIVYSLLLVILHIVIPLGW